ncbi:MAG: response regulator [Burkholderiales bacterium]
MFLGTQRVARVCHVTPATVASWIDQGHLKGHRTPTGRRRVASRDLVEFLRAHGMPVPPELLGDHAGETIVLVEDDVAYLRALVRTLERSDLDVEVVEATTGMDGLLEIGRVQPSLIVLDYRLPDLNAAQLIERLLQPGRGPDAEIVVVTAGMDDADVKRLRALGVTRIVGKTDGMDAVLDAIRLALGRPQAA